MKKLHTIKLGGWHRLWIIVSVIYLIPVINFNIDAFPKSVSDMPGSYSEKQASPGFGPWDKYKAIDNDKIRPTTKDLTRHKKALIAADKAGDVEAVKNLIAYIEKEEQKQQTFMPQTVQEPKKANLRRAQAAVVLEGFFAWIIPIAALYCVGWSVGWVYRGFQKESK